MLRILRDEDFNSRIIRGIVRLLPKIDLVSVQDIGMLSASDLDILEAASNEGRVLLTHDASTMPREAFDRIRFGQPMPGLVVCAQQLPIGTAITDIALLAECSEEGEWANKVIYLPL
jgi:predicted nuclease of predicted toxin-antitoxin system